MPFFFGKEGKKVLNGVYYRKQERFGARNFYFGFEVCLGVRRAQLFVGSSSSSLQGDDFLLTKGRCWKGWMS